MPLRRFLPLIRFLVILCFLIAFVRFVPSIVAPGGKAEGLAISVLPSKTAYAVGDALDLTGLVVTYAGKKEEVIAESEYTASGFDSLAAGTKTITISYEGESVRFPVWVYTNDVIAGAYGRFNLVMTYIPSGHFRTSAPAINSFYMGKYPITQEQYAAVMGKNPSEHSLAKGR